MFHFLGSKLSPVSSLVLPSKEIKRVLPNLLRNMANHHGWSIVNFSASKMHLPHHRRTSKFPWSPVATYSVNCKTHHLWHCLGGATTAGPNPSAKTIKTSLQNYIAMLRYPRIPHEQTCDCYYCIVLLASPLVNCHAGVIEFNTHIVSSPQHVTGVLIM